ncbi:MAG: adenine phosphoribosyltransferase [Rhizobiales bacterium]|nr:adenine phosphoribosyltransferase [Hyphomicrobiales bacterium]NRB14090.1 adenine phosphoribosyltransferase [Hyphomicrobiales bacterium]
MSFDIKPLIRTIPDYPHKGIMFRDVTTLFGDANGMREVVQQLAELYKNQEFDLIAGIDARGFIIGGALAIEMGKGFIPIRKKGKLPADVISEEYDLEYGSAIIEIHEDALKKGQKILLLDDLLATGGTALAGIKLIRRLGGIVEHAAFIVDLPELGGSKRLADDGIIVSALCAFDGA